MRQSRATCWKVIAGLLLFVFLLTSTHLAADSPRLTKAKTLGHGWLSRLSPSSSGDRSKPSNVVEIPLSKKPNPALLENSQPYVDSIISPENSSISTLDCPAPKDGRYAHLKSAMGSSQSKKAIPKYFFALDLHDCVYVLPRLMSSILETMHFLGPENCALSIVEGRSKDGTFEVLMLLREHIESIGAKYYLQTSDLHPGKNNTSHRIEALAALRNIALQPFVEHPEQYVSDPVVIFLNDVAICTEDILELIHQRIFQNADMTCAMDWTFVGVDPTFYDVWISRTIKGDSFFDFPPDGSWSRAWDLFWNDDEALSHQENGQPFQVFACWNGAVVVTAKPFIEGLRFRATRGSECFQGEPSIFCKEMWYLGFRKIAVIPSVNLEYNDESAKKIKAQKGYVSQWLERQDETRKIDWEQEPPSQVKCLPKFDNQTWFLWDEALPDNMVMQKNTPQSTRFMR